MNLSIIVPIYNAERFLKKCLTSIFKQITKEDEIILINDGSTDNSLYICQQFKKKYNNNKVILVNKKNEGISIARNTGIKLASGDYIFWVDSDDYLSDNCIKNVKIIIKKYNTDIILFDFYYKKNNFLKKDTAFRNKLSGALEKSFLMKEIAQDSFKSFLWRTVAKRYLYKNIKFPLGIQMMEDFFMYHRIFHEANSFFYIKKHLYYYRLINSSLSHKNKNVSLLYKIVLERNSFFEKYYSNNIAEKYRIVPVISAICLFKDRKNLDERMYLYYKRLIRKYLYFLLTRKYLSINKKIQIIIAAFSRSLLIKVRQIYNK